MPLSTQNKKSTNKTPETTQNHHSFEQQSIKMNKIR